MFVLKKHCSARFLITSRHSASRAHFADVLIAHPLPTRFFSDRKKNVSQCTGVKQWIGSGFTALFLPPNFPNPCRRFSTVLLHPHRGMGNTSSHRQPSPPATHVAAEGSTSRHSPVGQDVPASTDPAHVPSASAPVPTPTHVAAEGSTSRHSPLGQDVPASEGDESKEAGLVYDMQSLRNRQPCPPAMDPDEQYATPVHSHFVLPAPACANLSWPCHSFCCTSLSLARFCRAAGRTSTSPDPVSACTTFARMLQAEKCGMPCGHSGPQCCFAILPARITGQPFAKSSSTTI